IPSPYAGRVVERCGAVGDALPVGSVLVRIETSGETPPKVLVGYGADDKLDTSRRPRRPRASPAVRKLASDVGINLSDVTSSGEGDAAPRADVLAASSKAPLDKPVIGVQARMAERMALSRHNIPDAHASVDVDGTALMRLSDQFSAADLDVSPFVL